jgi:NAD(P)H-dependent flavin oxidoreductase YrpB (nitropropane dioxygenase family)
MHPTLHTRVCDLFGVRHPIVQTGMGWVAGSALVTATAEAGGLGILAAATMTFDELEAAIDRVLARTDKPFGVNLRGDQPHLERTLDLLIDRGIRVASFARAPSADAIAKLKRAGLVCMPTIGAPRHAEKVAAWGVDAVIAQGAEGGGHTGTIPTSLLIPAVRDAVDLPVIAAGGFRDGRGLVAALAWGADGIAMGTRFLLTQESHVPEAVKQRYLGTRLDGTVVTTAVDGYPQRVVRTDLVDRLERSGPVARLLTAVQHALAFRAMTGTSLVDLFREGLQMRQNSKCVRTASSRGLRSRWRRTRPCTPRPPWWTATSRRACSPRARSPAASTPCPPWPTSSPTSSTRPRPRSAASASVRPSHDRRSRPPGLHRGKCRAEATWLACTCSRSRISRGARRCCATPARPTSRGSASSRG